MSIKGKYPESTPLYAALLSAGAVAAVVVFFIVYSAFSNGDSVKPEVPVQTSASAGTQPDDAYIPEDELAEEMKDEATRLISQNYTVLKLYYTRGLPHKEEPYGNMPEDGYYTVDSDEYSSLKELEKIVDSTYTKAQAKTVKENSLGYGPIYTERSNGTLGIIANFTEMPYDLSWDDPTFSISPVSEKECGITLTLHKRDSDEEATVSGTMTKTKNGWRLKTVLF